VAEESKVDQLRAAGPRQAATLVFRKAVYRKVEMGRWGAKAGDHVAPSRTVDLRTELLGPDAYDAVADTNPHLSDVDLDHFHRQDTICITVYDGERIASSSWMTRGEVWHHELQRHIAVPDDEHFSCRSYVDPDYRGRSLFSHMVYSYARSVPADDLIWGLVYEWNLASVLSLERIGWRHSGVESSTYLFGRQRAHSARTPERPPHQPPS